MTEMSHGLSMRVHFASGSLAACGAVTITNPFDMLKTRRQLLNELGNHLTKSPTTKLTFTKVLRSEGIKSLQKGLLPAYSYQILMNGTRFMIYEPLRKYYAHVFDPKRHSTNLLCNASAAAVAGCLGASLGSPFNLIKTRLQSSSLFFATGHQHEYKGIIDASISIFRTEGIYGFYKGVKASMLRTAVGSAVQLSTYDLFKPFFAHLFETNTQSFNVQFSSAMSSGIFSCLAMNPFDVIMTRLYNQKGTTLYRSMLDCFWKTVKIEGFSALYRGLVPHYIRVGPHTVITLVLMEQIKCRLINRHPVDSLPKINSPEL